MLITDTDMDILITDMATATILVTTTAITGDIRAMVTPADIQATTVDIGAMGVG
jgi:hypothetical protein